MSTQITSPINANSRLAGLPDEPYIEILKGALIQPNPEVVSILKEMHLESVTPKFTDDCFQIYDSVTETRGDPEVPVIRGVDFEFYEALIEAKGLVPESRFVAVFRDEHMRRLTRVLARRAYKQCQLRFNQAKINRPGKGGQ